VKYELCGVDDLQPGEMRAAEAGPVAVVVIRKADGSYRALRDRCSHHGAPLSRGLLEKRVTGDDVGERDLAPDLIVRCPWHGYEFDVDSGLCPADPERVRVKSYELTIENGKVMLER
jgi:nitrite reductase/ring-hydroxylating ferredoxin subunit